MGIDPNPLTLREIWLMSEGKLRQEWEHTSNIMSIIHNVNCKKNKQKSADHFNPMIPKHKKSSSPGQFKTKDFYVLKGMLKNVGGPNDGS